MQQMQCRKSESSWPNKDAKMQTNVIEDSFDGEEEASEVRSATQEWTLRVSLIQKTKNIEIYVPKR